MKPNKIDIPPADVRAWFHYDPETGILTWAKAPSKGRPERLGKPAFEAPNSLHRGKGYRAGRWRGVNLYQHRVIWCWMTGAWPDGVIDHINGDKLDNRWCNLRAADNALNSRNRPMPKNNTTGVVGVYWQGSSRNWLAQIRVNRELIHLGSFPSKDDAVAARKRAEQEHGFHENHGRIVN